MKLKLTYIQFMALYNMLQSVAIQEMPAHLEPRRDFVIIQGIYQKFYAKAWEKKRKYSISLKPYEALTWFIYFSLNSLPETSLTGNTLRQINNTIHQKFAV